MNQDVPQIESRWKDRLLNTVIITALFLFIYPMFICGCHFHVSAIPINLLPIVWGFYVFLTHRDRKEQIVGWLALCIAILSILFGFITNIVHALR